jgi:hypothetical protein
MLRQLLTVASISVILLVSVASRASAVEIVPSVLPGKVLQAVKSTYAFGRSGHDYGGVSAIQTFSIRGSADTAESLHALVEYLSLEASPFAPACHQDCAMWLESGDNHEAVVPFLDDLIADFEGAPGSVGFLRGLSAIRQYLVDSLGLSRTEFSAKLDAIHKVSVLVDASNRSATVVWFDLGA